MIDTKQFTALRKDIEKFEEQRERVILLSRRIIQQSKLIIYAVHRNELKTVVTKIKEIKKDTNELRRIASKNVKLKYIGAYKVAIQEYVEALAYYQFAKDGTIPSWKSLGIDGEYYLLGLCDFAGELVRRAAQALIKKNFDETKKIEQFLEQLHGELLGFELRSPELRKKADAVRWSLKQLEDLIFQAEMKGNK